MKSRIAIFLCVACFFGAVRLNGQGTFQVTFDGPPIIPPGAAISVTNYEEAGMSFRPIPHPPPGLPQFGRVGPATLGFADNGTVHLKAALGDSLMFSFINGSLFSVVSLDLAEYSAAFQEPITVQFIGYYADGSTVSTSFTTDGIIDGTGPLADFQTFLFPNKEWSGLTRVEIPAPGWSLDNLVVSVPEPGTGVLLVISALGLLAYRKKTPTQELKTLGERAQFASHPEIPDYSKSIW